MHSTSVLNTATDSILQIAYSLLRSSESDNADAV